MTVLKLAGHDSTAHSGRLTTGPGHYANHTVGQSHQLHHITSQIAMALCEWRYAALPLL